MANDNEVSVDEYLAKRKGVTTEKGHVRKGVIQTDAKGAMPSSHNKETGETRYTMTTDQEDRDKDIVKQEGLSWAEFLKNPAAPFAHRSSDFPIGAWKDVAPVLDGTPKRHDGTLVPTKGDPVADRYRIHAAAGTIRACSIGFAPKTIRRREQDAESYSYPGYEILSAEIYECSPCLIPANPGALAKAATEQGILPEEFLAEILDKWTIVDGLVLPRKAFEEERAKYAVGKTFSFGERTFKAQDNGLSVIVPTIEKASDVKKGDFVSWSSSGGTARGKVDLVKTDGAVEVPGATVTGTTDDPAAKITVWKQADGSWSASDVKVAHKCSTLTKIAALKEAESEGLVRRIARAFGFTDDESKDAEAVRKTLQKPAEQQQDNEPSAEEKAAAAEKAQAEDLDDDIRELEGRLAVKSVRVPSQAAA